MADVFLSEATFFSSAPDTPSDYQHGELLTGNAAEDEAVWSSALNDLFLQDLSLADQPTLSAQRNSLVIGTSGGGYYGKAPSGGTVRALDRQSIVIGHTERGLGTETADVLGESYYGGLLIGLSRSLTGDTFCHSGPYAYGGVSVFSAFKDLAGTVTCFGDGQFSIVTVDANRANATTYATSSILALLSTGTGLTADGRLNVGAIWSLGSSLSQDTEASVFALRHSGLPATIDGVGHLVVGEFDGAVDIDGTANASVVQMLNDGSFSQSGVANLAVAWLDEGIIDQTGKANVAIFAHTPPGAGSPSEIHQDGNASLILLATDVPTTGENLTVTTPAASRGILGNIASDPRVNDGVFTLDGWANFVNIAHHRGDLTIDPASKGNIVSGQLGHTTLTKGTMLMSGSASIMAGKITRGSTMEVTGIGCGAFGYGGVIAGEHIRATGASNCWQFGIGVNPTAGSIGVGAEVQIHAEQNPTSPRPGSMWFDGTNWWRQDAAGAATF